MRLQLLRHPETPSQRVKGVEVEWNATDRDEVLLTFAVMGSSELVIPAPARPSRIDGLWRATCFEVFWRAEDSDSYIELNLSPSGCWAAYSFDDYRMGMQPHPMAVEPFVEVLQQGDCFTFDAAIDFTTFSDRPAQVALAAVIEETNGTKSYWALRHPPGPPDFHHPDCFALKLPAPD